MSSSRRKQVRGRAEQKHCNGLPRNFSSEKLIEELKVAASAANPRFADVWKDLGLSKYLDERLVPAQSRAEAAIAKWRSIEDLNSRANQRLYLHQVDKDFGWVKVERLIRYMQRFCREVLGRVPDVRRLRGSITNGATTRIHKGPEAMYEKISGEVHCSTSALPAWLYFCSGTPFGGFRGEGMVRLVDQSVLLTVPKKTEIDRVIAKEPECNALLQRMYGLHIRKRLLKVGIDLETQVPNQDLAFLGSVTGRWATIDFSSASDTLTCQLVLLLLPPEWFEVLDALRVKETRIGNHTHELELFSSMGNGFTFELETLIFLALARAVCYFSGVKGKILVYGDDVVIPTKAARRYMRVSRFFGLKPNLDKSMVDGYVRESCGKYYHCGRDVTPFYVRGEIKTYHNLITVLNAVLKWDSQGWHCFQTRQVWEWWQRWSRFVPRYLRGGWDPSDPTCLVDGTVGKTRLVSVVEELDKGVSPSGLLLSLWLGGEYSTPTRDLGRYRIGKLNRSFGTWTMVPGYLFQGE